MKRTITTLILVLALVGFVGLTASFAATPKIGPCCAAGYTDFIGAPGSCPTMDSLGANAPLPMGSPGV